MTDLAVQNPGSSQKNLSMQSREWFAKKARAQAQRAGWIDDRWIREKCLELFGPWWRDPYIYAFWISDEASVRHILRWTNSSYAHRRRAATGTSVCGAAVHAGDLPLRLAAAAGDEFPVCGRCHMYDQQVEQTALRKLEKMSGPYRGKTSLLGTSRKTRTRK